MKKFLIGVIIFSIIIAVAFKVANYRLPITRERFVDYMINNGYFVASGFVYTSGEDYKSGDNEGMLVNINAEIDELSIVINYFDFVDDDTAKMYYKKYTQEIRDKYFFKKSRQDILGYLNMNNYIKETSGDNFDRYIIRNPDGLNVTSIVSRISNTLIYVRDCSDTSYYKVRDSLGSIGY